MRSHGLHTALIAFFLLLTSCNDTPTRETTTTPTPVDRSEFTVTVTDVALLGISPNPQHSFRLRIPIQIRETAGLGANLNFVRLELFLAGQRIERAEMSSTEVGQKAGSNHVNARGTLAFDIDFDFNATDFDYIQMTLDLTDDRGNAHALVFDPEHDLEGEIMVYPDVLELGGHFSRFRVLE